MQCPDCKGEVPPIHSFCPHCRAVMPAVFASYESAASEKVEEPKNKRKAKSAKAAAVKDDGRHSHPLFALGWQAIPVLFAGVLMVSGFVAYRRGDLPGALSRVNEVANPTRPAQAAEAVSIPSPAPTGLVTVKPKAGKGEETGKPLATQATASAGLLIVKSPATARIYVNGKFAGVTPHSFTVAPGEHELVLIAEGYQDWLRKVAVKGNQQVGIMAALQKLPGR